jgi:hypothetical protein
VRDADAATELEFEMKAVTLIANEASSGSSVCRPVAAAASAIFDARLLQQPSTSPPLSSPPTSTSTSSVYPQENLAQQSPQAANPTEGQKDYGRPAHFAFTRLLRCDRQLMTVARSEYGKLIAL